MAPIPIGQAIALSAGVFEMIARGVAAKQQLDAAIAQAKASGRDDIPDSAVDAARQWAMDQRLALMAKLDRPGS